MSNETTVLEIRDDILAEAPIISQRGAWMAKIQQDEDSPGGLFRQWATRLWGENRCYEIMDWLKPGCVVEFGAVTNKGKKIKWYGVCLSVTPVSVAFKEFPMARGAFAWADSQTFGG